MACGQCRMWKTWKSMFGTKSIWAIAHTDICAIGCKFHVSGKSSKSDTWTFASVDFANVWVCPQPVRRAGSVVAGRPANLERTLQEQEYYHCPIKNTYFQCYLSPGAWNFNCFPQCNTRPAYDQKWRLVLEFNLNFEATFHMLNGLTNAL